jgi:hypothetical protein
MTRYAKPEIIKIHNDYKLRGGQGSWLHIRIHMEPFYWKQKTILLINSEMKQTINHTDICSVRLHLITL